MRRFLVVLVLLTSVSAPLAPGYGQRQTRKGKSTAASNAHGGAGLITSDQLKSYLYFIASDAMAGRDTPSPGLDATANFIAMNLAKWGFKPAGDDGVFFQKIALQRERLDADNTRAEFKGRQLKFGVDFLASARNSGTGLGQLVYVGDGWVIKNKDINPYKNIDVKDKVIVYNGGILPKGVSFNEIRGGKDGADYFSPLMYAQTHGAHGAIVVPTKQILENWDTAVHRVGEGGTLSVTRLAPPREINLPVITASGSLLGQLFHEEPHDSSDIISRRAA